mgnify:CR=1 FL=1
MNEMSQKNTFLSGEGNMWYQRNKSAFTTEKQKEDFRDEYNIRKDKNYFFIKFFIN